MSRLVVDIPVIETERLILRAPERRDLQHLVAFYQSERSHAVGGPRTENECWRSLSAAIGAWHFNGFGMWWLEHKADRRAIGATGFLNMPGWHEPELAWHLYDGYEGHGLAFEAAKAARNFGAAKLGLDGVISYIAPDNSRSRALAERLGADYESAASLMGHEVHIYRHPASKGDL